jgi:hypothetical protein
MLLPVTLSFFKVVQLFVATSICLTGTSHCWLEAMCSNTEAAVECSWPVNSIETWSILMAKVGRGNLQFEII